jgi:hypothetical protein
MATSFAFKPIVTDGLVLCLDAGNTKSYPGSGATWLDLTTNGNNGTLVNGGSGLNFVTTNGGSIVFDGTNDYIDNIGGVSTFSFIQNTGIYTISAWVNPSLTTKEMYILGNNNGTTAQKGFYFGTDGVNNSILLSITLGVLNSNTLAHVISNCYVANTWIYVTCVGNGINNKLYKNGVLLGTSNFSTLSSGNSSNTLSIGRINSANLWYWNGNIAQTTIYNRALSESEVLQNYNATKNRFI